MMHSYKNARKGKYIPKNPQKYIGDVTNIIYRSQMELSFMLHLDRNDAILSWGSEEIIVWYFDPISGRNRRYFPDFIFRTKDRTVMVEIKPFSETQEPKIRKKKSRKYLTEVATWGTNSAKWTQAREFCKDRGWEFIVLTERELYGKQDK